MVVVHKPPKRHKPPITKQRQKMEKNITYGRGNAAVSIPPKDSQYATQYCSETSEYEFGELLGAGAYAIVLRCTHIQTGK